MREKGELGLDLSLPSDSEEEEMEGGVLEMDREQGMGLWHWLHENWDSSCSSLLDQNFDKWYVNSPPEACNKVGVSSEDPPATTAMDAGGPRKRRRIKGCKNKEKTENQRLIHIAVERSRRRQTNDYLAVLRSLVPPGYVQRGDQASIIEGAINFVKELEQLLQSLEAQRFSGFMAPSPDSIAFPINGKSSKAAKTIDENRWAVANVEVTIVENHANLKILSRRRPKLLANVVMGLQNLQLTTLHLNVTTVDPLMVLYSFSVKVEDGCQLTTVEEIASAVHQMLGRIEEEAIWLCVP